VHENLPIGFTYPILAYGRRAGVRSLEKEILLLREIRSRAQHRTSQEQYSPLNQDQHPKSQEIAHDNAAPLMIYKNHIPSPADAAASGQLPSRDREGAVFNLFQHRLQPVRVACRFLSQLPSRDREGAVLDLQISVPRAHLSSML